MTFPPFKQKNKTERKNSQMKGIHLVSYCIIGSIFVPIMVGMAKFNQSTHRCILN